MPRKAAPFDFEDAVRRYLAGESTNEIAATVGVSGGHLRVKFREAGIMRDVKDAQALARAKQRPPWFSEAVELYESGMTQNAIGDRLGVQQANVSAAFKRHGVQARTRSEAERMKWTAMTAEQRAAQVKAAHDASRGVKRTTIELERRAAGKQRLLSHATSEEAAIGAALHQLGMTCIQQQAVGKYNLDLGAFPVAVELFGGGWHAHGRHRARLPQRVKDIADRGWNQLIAWTHAAHPLDVAAVAQDAVAYYERSRRNPSFRRQYRVIWGDGQFIAAGCVDDHQITLVPTGIRGIYARW